MRRFVFAAFALLFAAPAFAQSYPDRPVRIIVPTPAGGPVDVMAHRAGRLHADGVGGERANH
jgi:tripartite-type tricarboxylate transporter receptor subunit TctC